MFQCFKHLIIFNKKRLEKAKTIGRVSQSLFQIHDNYCQSTYCKMPIDHGIQNEILKKANNPFYI